MRAKDADSVSIRLQGGNATTTKVRLMDSLIGKLTSQLRALSRTQSAPAAMRSYRCQCGRPVFFQNSQCLACKTPLGYETEQGHVIPLEAGPEPDTWRKFGAPKESPLYLRCSNFETAAGCNWLVPAADLPEDDDSLCIACKLNRTIPDQTVEENRELWERIETAKRRLVSSLIALGLPVLSKEGADPERGLAFDLLRAPPEGPAVMTGHFQGIITINIEEADDTKRELIRKWLREPYRTLLGHFRHEVGHYYWDRLVLNSRWLEPFRALFGDERLDYAVALKAHYEHGPPEDWPKRFVSSYASTHPWEDWAESWAHYLHMVDTLDTSLSFGLNASDVEVAYEVYTLDDVWWREAKNADEFLGFINSWIRITSVMNELCRSMGQPDFYPFALPRAAVSKLHFIHSVVQSAKSEAALPLIPAA